MKANCTSGCGLLEGRRRRDKVQTAIQKRRASLIAQAERALLNILLAKERATIDDVRAALTDLPADADPRWLGATPKSLLAAGVIARDGFTASERPESHARYVSVWRIVDRDAAVRLLAKPSVVAPPPTAPTTPAPAAIGRPEAQRRLWEACDG